MKKIVILTKVLLFLLLLNIGITTIFLSFVKLPGIYKSYDAFGITVKPLKTTKIAAPIAKGSKLNKVSSKKKVTLKAKPKTKVTVKAKLKVSIPSKYAIVNIALFGVDRLNEKINGRADTTIVLTIDFARRKLKVTSFMRDLYVHIDGHGYTKLGHAYAYGGPKLAMKTINENFGLNIKEYCTLDFFTMAKVIDILGGVRVEVKADEIKYLNAYVGQISAITHKKIQKIKKAGAYVLNGNQGVAYTRIRSIGRGDFDRTERQRTVLISLVKNIESRGSNGLSDIFKKIRPYAKTDISDTNTTILGLNYLKIQPVSMAQERFPVDGYWKATTIRGVQYLKADMKALKTQVSLFINKDIKPGIRKKK
jgi:polyisoprenyl-teichoic acid--peptidoglycan teichoic acid transferase